MSLPLFDAARSHMLKERGMTLAAAKNPDLLEQARRGAYLIAMSRPDRCCNACDVGKWLDAHGLPQLGNSAGSLFKNGEWDRAGFTSSDSVKAHGRMIRVWRLRGAA